MTDKSPHLLMCLANSSHGETRKAGDIAIEDNGQRGLNESNKLVVSQWSLKSVEVEVGITGSRKHGTRRVTSAEFSELDATATTFE